MVLPDEPLKAALPQDLLLRKHPVKVCFCFFFLHGKHDPDLPNTWNTVQSFRPFVHTVTNDPYRLDRKSVV